MVIAVGETSVIDTKNCLIFNAILRKLSEVPCNLGDGCVELVN